MSMNVTKERFQSALNSEFSMHIENADVPIALQLVQFESKVNTPIQECFSLLFRAPADAPAVQMLCTLGHADLGAQEIFLVPVKKNADGLFYEAVFNRLLT